MAAVIEAIEAIEVLKKARARIADESDWTQGHYECDGALCALGAITQASGRRADDFWECERVAMRSLAARLLKEACGQQNIADFNDSHTHSEVIAAFDRAIEVATAEAAHSDNQR